MSLFNRLNTILNEAEGDEDENAPKPEENEDDAGTGGDDAPEDTPEEPEEDPPAEDEGTDFDFADDEGEGDPAEDDIVDDNNDDGDEPGDAVVDDTGDDTSMGDGTGDEAVEEINQPNILDISKLDKALLKKGLFENYKKLAMLLKRAMSITSNKRYLFDQEDKDYVQDCGGELLGALDTYMLVKFYPNNYETNLLNFAEFSKKIDDLIAFIDSLDKHKNND